MENQYIAALDIGSYWLRLGVQEFDSQRKPVGHFHVFHTYSSDIGDVIIQNPRKTVDAIVQLLNLAHDVLKHPIDQVCALAAVGPIEAKPGQIERVCQQRNGDDTVVAKDDVDEMQRDSQKIKAEFLTDAQGQRRALLHTIKLGFLTDASDSLLLSEDQAIGSVSNNVTLRYIFFLANEKAINRLRKCIRDAGLSLTKLYLEPDALQQCQQIIQNENGDALLINLGYSKTELFSTHNGKINHYHWEPKGVKYVVDTTCKERNLDPLQLRRDLIKLIDLSRCNFKAQHPADLFPQESIKPNSQADFLLWVLVRHCGEITLRLKKLYMEWYPDINRAPRFFTVYLGGGLAAVPQIDRLFTCLLNLWGSFPFRAVRTVGLPGSIDFHDLLPDMPHGVPSQAALYGAIDLARQESLFAQAQPIQTTAQPPESSSTPPEPPAASKKQPKSFFSKLLSNAVDGVNQVLGTYNNED